MRSLRRGALRICGSLYPDAAILAHPESPSAVLEVADVIGSTTQIINAAKQSTKKEIIVATDQGIFHKLQQVAPEQKIYHRTDGGQRRNLQKLCKLPMDGDELTGEPVQLSARQ